MNPIKPLAAALLIALPDATFAQADTAFSVQLEVKSQGVAMRAPLFVAAGPGPHPTLITFKGFPGGNALRRHCRTARPQDGGAEAAGPPDAAGWCKTGRHRTARIALRPVLDSLRAGQALVRDTTVDGNHNLTGSTDEFFTLQADWVRSCTR